MTIVVTGILNAKTSDKGQTRRKLSQRSSRISSLFALFSFFVLSIDTVKTFSKIAKFFQLVTTIDRSIDSLRGDEPEVVYIFARKEIANTKTSKFDDGKESYYLWYSEHYEKIRKKYGRMNEAANSLVKSLNKNPSKFERRWQLILDGKLQDALANVKL
jgi:hypothetical protein